jgi:internalin A
MKHLAGFKQLKVLSLERAKITEAGLREIGRLMHLGELALVADQQRPMPESVLKEFAGLTELRSLNLQANGATDAGVKHLAGLKHLRTLNLGFSNVTDESLRVIAGFPELVTLDVHATKVTGAGLKELAGLPHLETLKIGDTPAMDDQQAIDNLHKALPKLQIIFYH